jgi:hypothetical protein
MLKFAELLITFLITYQGLNVARYDYLKCEL